MDMVMTDHQMELRDTVRKFAEAELLPKYKHWDRSGEFLPKSFTDKLVDMGLLRLRMPEKYGGQKFSFVDIGIVCEEIGRCDPQVRYLVSSAVHIGEMACEMHPDLQDEWIPRIAGGEIMALAFTEPGGGSDAGNIRTKAVKDGDHYVINGEKAAYLRMRQVMGKPASKWQGVAHDLATEQTKLEAARLLAYRALSLVDRGVRHDPESSMAKWFGVKAANEAIQTCMRLHGHYGWSKDLP